MLATSLEMGQGVPEELPAAEMPNPSTGTSFVSFSDQQDPEARPAPAKSLVIPGIILTLFLMAAGISGALLLKRPANAVPAFQDLGAGISKATGIKGALQVRWQNGAAQYQVKFEPIDPLQSSGFSYAAANPPAPITFKMRILDSTGFTLCNKEIAFPYTGGTPGGMDVIQTSEAANGKVDEFSAQGGLPCTADQFRVATYWDFSTNFPTTAQQEALMKATAAEKARLEAAARAASRHSGFGFTAEGYDAVTGYDASRNVLETRLGRSFSVRNSDRTMASNWASASRLFHYKCDQRGRCALNQSGGGAVINVVSMQ